MLILELKELMHVYQFITGEWYETNKLLEPVLRSVEDIFFFNF